MRTLLLFLLLLTAGCIQPVTPPDDSGGGKPVSISALTKAARNKYLDQVATLYEEAAANPPATVLEAGEYISKRETEHWNEFLKNMADIMEPEIGSDELDPIKAKNLFNGIADGFRATPKKRVPR